MYVLRVYINRTLSINIFTIRIQKKKKILTINKYTVSSLNFFNRREHIELISNSEVCIYIYIYINNRKSVQFTINIKQYGFHTKLQTDYKQ